MNRRIGLGAELAFVFGTVIVIIISVAWVEMLAILRKVTANGVSPLESQFIFTFIITIVGISLLWKIQPFVDNIKGVGTALRSEREILTEFF